MLATIMLTCQHVNISINQGGTNHNRCTQRLIIFACTDKWDPCCLVAAYLAK